MIKTSKPADLSIHTLFYITLGLILSGSSFTSGQIPVSKEEITSVLTYPDSVPPLTLATFEQYFLNPTSENLTCLNQNNKNGTLYEKPLDLAIKCVNESNNTEAIKVLEQSPPCPAFFYWLSWLYRNSSLEKSNDYLKQAEDNSPYIILPLHPETIPILAWAKDKDDSWKTKYYLGLHYWHIQNIEKSMELFEQCGDIPDYAPFYIARAILFKDTEREYCMPCSDYNRAKSLGPDDWRTWHFQSNFLHIKGAFQEELKNSKQAYSNFPENPVIANDYTKAIKNLNR